MMGNPYFYHYPGGSGALVSVDMGRLPSVCEEIPLREVADSYSGSWSMSRLDLGQRLRVVIEYRRISLLNSVGLALEQNLRNLIDHLQQGYYVGFSLDHTKTWASYQSPGPLQRGTILYNTTNAFRAWSSSGAVAAADQVTIESGNPGGHREIQTVSANSGQITLTGGVRQSHQSQYGCLARYRWFFPSLYLPADQVNADLLQTESRIHFTCRLELEYDPGIITAPLALSGRLVSGRPTVAGGMTGGASSPGLALDLGLADSTAASKAGTKAGPGMALDQIMAGVRSQKLITQSNLTRFL